MYCSLEDLLIKAACQQDFTAEFQKVTDFYADDLNASSLSAQFATFASHFTDTSNPVNLTDCLKFYQKGHSLSLVKFANFCW